MYDYLVVGAGLSGMCFTDVILRSTNKSVMLVDRNSEPGGHWTDPYPYVSLHQNSNTYGVESIELKNGDGLSVKRHFQKALSLFKESKNFHCKFGIEIDMEDISIPHVTLVDATYLTVHRLPTKWNMETPWTIDTIEKPKTKMHVVVGGGKTGMDTCVYLRRRGIPVTWVVSHDAMLLKREKINNLGPVPKSVMLNTIVDFFVKKMNPYFALQLDNRMFSLTANPERHRCAIIKKEEYDMINEVKIIRKGYVKYRKKNTLYFENDSIDFGDSIFIDCIQNGGPVRESVPIFQPNKIVLQPIVLCQQSFSSTTIAKLEAKNIKLKLYSIKHPKFLKDGVHGYSTSMVNLAKLYNCEISDWIFKSRLNQYR